MNTIYNVIFVKSEWTKEKTIEFLKENEFKFTGLEENNDVYCYSINEKDITTDTKASLLVSLTPTVFLIVKDIGHKMFENSDDDSDDEKENPPPSLDSSIESLIEPSIKETETKENE